MTPEIQIILGSVLISGAITYAWWVRFRVWMLRQDLFTIRDELWDEMRSRHMLDDPAHRQLRDGVNAFIRVAPILSIFTILRTLAEGVKANVLNLAEPADEAIKAARSKVVARVSRYILFESLTGLILVLIAVIACAFILIPLRSARNYFTRLVGWVVDSKEMKDIGHLVENPPSGVLTGI